MKKRVVSLCLVALLAMGALIGGTVAYLTDTDSENNVFTVGNVVIELKENFGDNNPNTPEKLIPATGSAQASTLVNGVTKEVTVKNTGSEAAYVRVHIAIPQILDDGSETFDASQNVLHFNFSAGSVGEGKWDWSRTTGAPYTGDWNYYETAIDNVTYNVYVVTYESVLASSAETAEKAMHQVYLDSNVTNADITDITNVLGTNWQIKVVAEGVQAAGFTNAYDALNTAFGVPGSYDVDWSGVVAQ